jgi:hypothetical protein
VPWRFSAAGSSDRAVRSSLPAAENLHKNRTNAVQQRHISKFVLVASRNRTGGNITGVSFFKKKFAASTKQFPMQERRSRNTVKLEGVHLKVLSGQL